MFVSGVDILWKEFLLKLIKAFQEKKNSLLCSELVILSHSSSFEQGLVRIPHWCWSQCEGFSLEDLNLLLWVTQYHPRRRPVGDIHQGWKRGWICKGLAAEMTGLAGGLNWTWDAWATEESGKLNWCFWTVVLEKTLKSPLNSKEIQPVHPKGNQSWTFIGRTDAEAEAPAFGHLMLRTDSL